MGRVHKKKLAEYAEKKNRNGAVSQNSAKSSEIDNSYGSSEERNLQRRTEVNNANYNENSGYAKKNATKKYKRNEDSNDDILSNDNDDNDDDDEPLNDGLLRKAQNASSTIKSKKNDDSSDKDENTSNNHNVRKTATVVKRKTNEKTKKTDISDDEIYSDEDEPLIGGSIQKKSHKSSISTSEKKNKNNSNIADLTDLTDLESDQEETKLTEEYEVKEIVGSKIENGITYYLIRWKGYTKNDDTWEPEDTLSCPELIQKFKKKRINLKKDTLAQKKITIGHSKGLNKTVNDPNKEWEVEKIVDYAETKAGKVFRVRWKGFKPKHDTWEPESNLSCDEIIEKFMERMKSQEFVTFKVLREDPKKTKRLVNETAPITNYHNAIGRKSKRNMMKQRIFYGDDDE